LAQGQGLVDRMGGLGAAIDEAALLGGAPLGRDQLPEVELLPAEENGLLHRLAGASAFEDDASADSDGEGEDHPTAATPTAADLLPVDARAALRLLAPFVLSGGGSGGSGIQARLPYEIELR